MFWVKYAAVAFLLATWCNCLPSGDDSDDNQGEREKRTLILGVLFKKLLLQQVLGRSLSRNVTTAAPPPAMMGPLPEQTPSVAPPPDDSSQSTPQESPQHPLGPETTTNSQGQLPQQILPSKGFVSSQILTPFQGFAPSRNIPSSFGFPGQSLTVFNPQQPPVNQKLSFPLNFPFGIQGFRQLPFGPAPPLGAQAGPQGNSRITSNIPFGIQNGLGPQQGLPFGSTFRPDATSQLLPTGPGGDLTQRGPPLPPSGNGADGPQGPSPSESVAQQSGPEASGPQGPKPSAAEEQGSQQDLSFNPTQQTLSPQSGPDVNGQQQTAQNVQFGTGPSAPPPESDPGQDKSQGLPRNFQFGTGPSAPPPQSGPELDQSQGLPQNFQFGTGPSAPPPQSGPELDQAQALPRNFQFESGPSAQPQPSGSGRDVQQELTQNFQFGPPQSGPGGDTPQGLPPNFSFGTDQQTPSDPAADNIEQGASRGQPESENNGLPSNLQFGGPFDNNLQQQFGPLSPEQPPSGRGDQPPNSFPSNVRDLPPNFRLPNGEPQPGQAGNGLFDPRQFSGSNNNVFDFAQQDGPQDDDRSQPQTQSGPFQNGLFSPNGEQSFNSANNPQSNFAFNDQQFGLTSLFQNGNNFQSNFFQ